MSMPAMIQIPEDKLNDAHFVMMAIRALSDLLCNQQLNATMEMVRPENLEALMSILADTLEQSLPEV